MSRAPLTLLWWLIDIHLTTKSVRLNPIHETLFLECWWQMMWSCVFVLRVSNYFPCGRALWIRYRPCRVRHTKIKLWNHKFSGSYGNLLLHGGVQFSKLTQDCCESLNQASGLLMLGAVKILYVKSAAKLFLLGRSVCLQPLGSCALFLEVFCSVCESEELIKMDIQVLLCRWKPVPFFMTLKLWNQPLTQILLDALLFRGPVSRFIYFG